MLSSECCRANVVKKWRGARKRSTQLLAHQSAHAQTSICAKYRSNRKTPHRAWSNKEDTHTCFRGTLNVIREARLCLSRKLHNFCESSKPLNSKERNSLEQTEYIYRSVAATGKVLLKSSLKVTMSQKDRFSVAL